MRGTEHLYAQYRAGDARFHVSIAMAAKSPHILRGIIEVQTTLSEVLDLMVYHAYRSLANSTEYHWRIFQAICDHNPVEARQLMLDHVVATENIIHGLVPEADWPLHYTASEDREVVCAS